ncbi:tetratricopeptide (TPR) repeat protein [Dysgonomonas sp. PH5-45]|uniref:tetratricopeptide repeat protein n=1 Tax=unclassified Dysgonomonas TaxID=2630389 RepID=UPI002474868F|nr:MULTISPECIES: tetratricopeptide repeat protein [unclassified Dysgonomonas]MDH6355689.1 tetratricopeptide (TPR) repeat protein [Dysgonomonas sp. PH5-45]MDH6388586.1 tetratricopeptide (TPR) repeat protein [Dysgonomonas sp. PH5-37]
MNNTVFIHKILPLCFFLLFPLCSLFGNTEKECDRLIEQGINAAQKEDYVKSLEFLNEAKIIAENSNLHKQHFWTLTNIGINYAEMLDYSEALDNFLEAYKIALKHLDARNEMSILNNIAGLYLLDKKYDKADEYFKKVYDYAKETKDSLLIGGCAMNIALTGNYINNVKQAEEYLVIASEMLKNQPKELIQAKTFRISTLILKGDYEQAEKLSLELMPMLEDIELRNLKISVLIQIIKINNKKKNYKKALEYCRMALNSDANIENKAEIYALMSNLFQANGQYDKALAYKDSIMTAIDSLNIIKDGKHFENSRIKFELLKNEKELSDSQSKLKTERIIFVSVIIIAVIITLILIWAFRNKSVKNKQRQKIVELELEQEKNKKILLEKQLQEQETLALLEQERLTNEQERLMREIESKNRELTAKALFLSNRNELIENIVNSLSDSHEVSNNKKLLDNIQQLKNQLKENTELDSFISHFEQINQNFIAALREKHSNLTANEVRFLSCIYINLNTKEISSLLNITPEYCKKKKQQIAQKMGLTSTSLLYSYISKL